MKTLKALLLVCAVLLWGSCSKTDNNNPQKPKQNLTIFFVNDVHGQIDNFSKVKKIVDTERANNEVLVVSAGDLFSGNPVVDNYENKGFPMIDLLNKVGFNAAVIGNHEFDYGPEILKERIEQATFPWVCANATANKSTVVQPEAYHTLSISDLKITFLGLLETGGSKFETIPSSHPWKVNDYTFKPAQDVLSTYSNLKKEEESDLLIVLSHLGHKGKSPNIGDFELAKLFPSADLIIGGHSHALVDTTINNTPIVQTGAYLHYLGKIELSVENKAITSMQTNLINLDNYNEFDADLKATIDSYNNWPELDRNIGTSEANHSKSETGFFYCEALLNYMNVDVTFQNTGGVRYYLDKGTITPRDIYTISPFNNGTVIYDMTVAEIKTFLSESGSGFYYTGIRISNENGDITIRDNKGRVIPDDHELKVGINDYIPAVHPAFFPTDGKRQTLTASETIIAYLEGHNEPINYTGQTRYFRY